MKAGLRSFRSQFIVGTAIGVTVMLTLCGFSLCQLLRQETEFIYQGELQEHAVELEKLVDRGADGRLVLRAPLSDPRFMGEKSGYYWQIARTGGPALTSPSLGGVRLGVSDVGLRTGAERFGVLQSRFGKLLYVEEAVRLDGFDDRLGIVVAMEARIVDDIAARLGRVVGLALSVVGLGLIFATAAHLYLGFQFLDRLKKALADVRAGRVNRLPEDLPDEVMPLVSDFNALIGVNEEMVRRARLEAGNLAHSLKTPLAILIDEAYRLRRTEHCDEARNMIVQCERIRRTVEFQLARARASLVQGTTGAVACVEPLIAAGVAALARLHAARDLHFEARNINPEIALACASGDFEEIFMPLVDNAAKWARHRVAIGVEVGDATARFFVDDDGPGVPPGERERIFEAGARLDEAAPGSGFGLGVAREIADLYGGRVWVESSPLGGARACVELPLVR